MPDINIETSQVVLVCELDPFVKFCVSVKFLPGTAHMENILPGILLIPNSGHSLFGVSLADCHPGSGFIVTFGCNISYS